ncbi:MAG: ROK family protein [Dehalococcoidia bacterium]|nr:ROK family protein [Dehalococcoidia bacterium]
MARSKFPVVGVDIGGTKIIAAVFDGDGAMLSRIYCLTLGSEGPDRVINRISSTISKVIEKAGLKRDQVGCIGIAAAGAIDINRGIVADSPNIPRWQNIPLRDRLLESLGGPLFVLNDANAAALAEHRLGAGRGLNNLIYITVSTGIGGGMIIDGELYQGTDGSAAEIGHMIIKIGGPVCKCGKRGCFEAMASGTAIARLAQKRLRRGEKSIIPGLAHDKVGDVTAQVVAEAARKGDALARAVIEESAGYLGIGVANLVNLMNPQMIIIGGGVSKMGEMILSPTRRSMKANAINLPARTVRLVRPRLGVDAELTGAALYARDMLRMEA